MTPDESLQARLRLATAVAAAAITVAVGLTIASLSGYWSGSSPASEAGSVPAPGAVPAGASADATAPDVVLVPVQSAVLPAAPAEPPSGLVGGNVAEWSDADAPGARAQADRRTGDDDDDDDGEDGARRTERRGRGHEEREDDD